MLTWWTLMKPLSSVRNLRRSKFVSPTPPPCYSTKHRCALDGGPHTAFATHWSRKVTQILRLEETKKNRLNRFPTFRASRTYNIPVPYTPCPLNTTNSYAKESPSLSSIPRRETRVPKPNRQIPRSLTTAEKTAKSGENFSLTPATPRKNSPGSKEQTASYLSECKAFLPPPSRATRLEQRAKHQPGYFISPSARRSTLPSLGKSLSISPSKRKARSSWG